LRLGGTVDKDASAIAVWVMRVMNEAELLPVATQLHIRQEAYRMATEGALKRDILVHFVNEIFFTTPMREADSEAEFKLARDAGHYVSGKT